MIEAVGVDLGGYSRAHVVYSLFMMGFGVGYRVRQCIDAGRIEPWVGRMLLSTYRETTDPWRGGFRLGYQFGGVRGNDGQHESNAAT